MQLAKQAMTEREVTVDRLRLLKTLRYNKEMHILQYEKSVEGFKEAAIKQLRAAEEKAKIQLAESVKQAEKSIEGFDPTNPEYRQRTLIERVVLDLPVPRCYADVYDAAIALAEWEDSKLMVLSFAEFSCFVRDEWEWKDSFVNIANSYIGIKG